MTKLIWRTWNLYEILWLAAFCAIAVIVTIATGDTPFGFTVFLSGVLCVILAAKGSIFNYAVGVYNTFGYAWLAWQNGLFGEVGLNLLFFAPMNIIGFLMWRNHRKGDSVQMRRMTGRSVAVTAVVCVVSIAALGLGLSFLPGQNSPYIDATTNVLSVAATLLMARRYREQWLAYITLNVFTVIMWTLRAMAGSDQGVLMVVMWSAYLINSVYGLLVWSKGSKEVMA